MLKKMLITVLVLALMLTTASLTVAAKGPGGGGGGGGGDIPDTGELYGDLYVILRDEDGRPLRDANSCIQPISAITASVTIATDNGPLTIEAYEGEPFSPPYYTLDGDLVACELTEDMATWVQTVDFGRLNLGRAPDAVINHAFDEAINKMNSASAFDIDPAGRLMMLLGDEWFTIDSPAENLALYIKMMKDGHWITTDTAADASGGRPEGKGPPEGDGPSAEDRPVLKDTAVALLPVGLQGLGDEMRLSGEELTNEELLLAASLLAGAADKTGTMTLDKVMYINSIYGINQNGTIEDGDNRYFNFGARGDGAPYGQDRDATFSARSSGETCEDGQVWVLQPEGIENHYIAQCVSFKTLEFIIGIFNNYYESYTLPVEMEFDYIDNVRGFVQSADDALQVLEYIHNYSVPE